MGYSSNPYRRGYVRAVQPGRVARPNRRPGACHYCQAEVPALAGQLYMESSGAWSVAHPAAEWAGSPVSGQYVGGCPDGTAQAPRESGKYAYTAPGARMTSRRGRCEDAPCCGCCG